jgi:hypothetical protein
MERGKTIGLLPDWMPKVEVLADGFRIWLVQPDNTANHDEVPNASTSPSLRTVRRAVRGHDSLRGKKSASREILHRMQRIAFGEAISDTRISGATRFRMLFQGETPVTIAANLIVHPFKGDKGGGQDTFCVLGSCWASVEDMDRSGILVNCRGHNLPQVSSSLLHKYA